MQKGLDLAMGTGILIAAGILFHETFSIPEPRFEPMGSAVVPQAVLLLMAVLAISLIVQALRAKKGKRDGPDGQGDQDTAVFRRQVRVRTAVTLGAVVVYTATLSWAWLPYYPATFVFATGLTAYLSRGNRKYTLIAACVAGGIIGLLHAFVVTMDLILPTM